MWPYYTILEATLASKQCSETVYFHSSCYSRCEIYSVFTFLSLEPAGNTWPVGTDHNFNQSWSLMLCRGADSLWLFLFPIYLLAAQPKEFFLDGLKKLEQ
jgi:hypothetical protein